MVYAIDDVDSQNYALEYANYSNLFHMHNKQITVFPTDHETDELYNMQKVVINCNINKVSLQDCVSDKISVFLGMFYFLLSPIVQNYSLSSHLHPMYL